MSTAKSEELQEPVDRWRTGGSAISPAKALELRALSGQAPRRRALFCVPVGDMRWYLNIFARKGIIYHLLPSGKGDAY
jgi:hypothetical protein